MKHKSSCFILLLSLCIFSSTLYAANSSYSSHESIINEYIIQLNQVMNQVFTLAEKTTFSTPASKSTFNTDLGVITSNLRSINDSMTNYYNSLESDSLERRNVTLLFNAVNLIQNNLFELTQLNNAATSVEKMLILETYFRFRVEATDTLNNLNYLLQQT